jgi:hypothetical protein
MAAINRQQNADKVWNGYTALGALALVGAAATGIGSAYLPLYTQGLKVAAGACGLFAASYLWPAVKDGCKQLKEKVTSLKRDLGTAPIALAVNTIVGGACGAMAVAAGATLPIAAAIAAGSGAAAGLASAYLTSDSTPARRAAPAQGQDQPNAARIFEAELFGAIAAPDEDVLDCINEPGPLFEVPFVSSQRKFSSVKEALQYDYENVTRNNPGLWQSRVKTHSTDSNQVERALDDPTAVAYPTYAMIKILIAKFSQDGDALGKFFNITDFSKFKHPSVKLPEVLQFVKDRFIAQINQRAQASQQRQVRWAQPAQAAAPQPFNIGSASNNNVRPRNSNGQAKKRRNNGELFAPNPVFGQAPNPYDQYAFNPYGQPYGQAPNPYDQYAFNPNVRV